MYEVCWSCWRGLLFVQVLVVVLVELLLLLPVTMKEKTPALIAKMAVSLSDIGGVALEDVERSFLGRDIKINLSQALRSVCLYCVGTEGKLTCNLRKIFWLKSDQYFLKNINWFRWWCSGLVAVVVVFKFRVRIDNKKWFEFNGSRMNLTCNLRRKNIWC